MIRFNEPYSTGKELTYIAQAIEAGHLSGDGPFTRKCREIFRARYGFENNFLTTSCTDALEMAAILARIAPGDEVIMPSYTFVSTANAFILRGARVVFVDSLPEHPNMDHRAIASAITPRTKVIVPMHYAGMACEMDPIMALAEAHDLLVVEDAAQAIDATYKGRPLGGIGHLAAFSFHETKNIISGEGGMLTVNKPELAKRAEIIREKGTDRSAFFRGEVDKYGWVDIGSSYLASEVIAAFLFAQLEAIDDIQRMRVACWQLYNEGLRALPSLGYGLPQVPEHASINGHLFYVLCPDLAERDALIAHLAADGIKAVFHYQPLHRSAYHLAQGNKLVSMSHAERYGNTLLRLPLFAGLSVADQDHIIASVLRFVERR